MLPARSQQKTDEAVARIRASVPSASVVPAILDLASQQSVADFAVWFSQRFPGPSLDLLISNAGVMAVPTRELTVDGWERQFATNFLGPFALIARLYGHVRQQQGSRIVIVSSSVTKWGKLDFRNLQSERRYNPMQTYGQSKLADSIFAVELQRRLTNVESPVVAVAAHPGYAITNLQTTGPGTGFSLFTLVGGLLKPWLSQDAAHGALPTLFAAAAPEAVPGGYYGPDGLFELKGHPTSVTIPNRATQDGERLWKTAEQLTGTTLTV